MISFLNSILFIVLSFPLWGVLSFIAVLIAFAFGALIIFLQIIVGVLRIFNVFDEKFPTLANLFEITFELILNQLFSTIIRAWNWGSYFPEFFWDFASNGYPWIAFAISIFILIPLWKKVGSQI